MIRSAEKYTDTTQRSAGSFEQQYIALREKEHRVYTDEQVMQLPIISKDHPHYAEWLVRKHSSEKLIKQLRKMKRPLHIMEIGCGNGWLSNKLAGIPGAHVTGFDINATELQQAKRVFHQQHLKFVSDNPFLLTHLESYDVIVFAAAIQYFPSLNAIISDAMQCLSQQGQIHIIDSHFYKPEDVPAAKQRTASHYASLGFPGMSAYYFHHTLNTLQAFNAQILYNPNTIWNKLRRTKSPFHWICIKKT